MKKHRVEHKEGKRSSHQFWEEIIREAEGIDFREPMPEISPRFIHIWARHYFKIASMVPLQEPILEVGAGYGVLAAGLGIISNEKVKTTEHPSRGYLSSSSYQHFLKKHGVELFPCDLLDGLPFEKNSFKQVYFCDVIEHLPPAHISFVLQEIYRVLMPGGTLILSTPNLNRLSGLFRFMAGYSVNPPIEVSKIGQTYGHIREFAPKEINKMLLKSGFKPDRCVYEINPFFTVEAFGDDNNFSIRKAKLINALTTILVNIFPRTGDEMFIAAQKSIDQ